MEKLISVIIPVYNVEKYLSDCLDSVLSSTYKNLEIILVNDGSMDNSGTICDTYAAKDSRIIVIHQENQGLSAARNTGLDRATGEYVGFVDSDDKISKNMYEELYCAIEKEGADIAACEWTRKEEELLQFDNKEAFLKKNHIVTGVERCLSVVMMEPSTRNYTYTECMVWDKLYCRKKIKQIFEIEAIMSEDLQFNWNYVKGCSKMVIVPMNLYFWRINLESVTHNRTLDSQISIANSWFKIVEEFSSIMIQECNIQDNELKHYLCARGAYWGHNALWNIVGKDKETMYSVFVKQTRSMVKKYFKEVILSKDTEWKVRIPVVLFRYCEPIWRCVAKLYQKYQ